MEKNKTGKYLKYAIGEIILVVIGILFALSINNWNESRKDKAKVDRLLKKVQKDIELDYVLIRGAIPYYAVKDSLAQLVLSDKLIERDYRSNNSQFIHNIVTSIEPMNLKRGGYDNLMQVEDIIPIAYDSVMEQLKIQYDNQYKILDKIHDFFLERAINHEDFLFKNYEWYSNPEPRYENQKAIDFYLNDMRYKGLVSRYQDNSLQYTDQAAIYMNKALDNYQEIDSILNNSIRQAKFYGSNLVDSNILGNYKHVSGDTLKIYTKNNRYYILGRGRDQELFPYNKNKFFVGPYFFRFSEQNDSLNLYITAREAGRKPIATKIDNR